MLHIGTCVLILEIIANIECNTVPDFDNKHDVKVRYVKTDTQSVNNSDLTIFTDFVKELIQLLKTYNNDDLEDTFAIIDNEMKNSRNNGFKFHELVQNKDMRRFVTNKLDRMKEKPGENIRRYLDNSLVILENAKYNEKRAELIDFINSLYEKEHAEALGHVINSLKQYGGKYKRANTDLIKIIKNGLRTVLFDHFSELDTDKKADLKIKLETFWKDFAYRGDDGKILSLQYNRKVKANVDDEVTNEEENSAFTEEAKSDDMVEGGNKVRTPPISGIYKKLYNKLIKVVDKPPHRESESDNIYDEREAKETSKKRKTTPISIISENQAYKKPKIKGESFERSTIKKRKSSYATNRYTTRNTKKKRFMVESSTKRLRAKTVWSESENNKGHPKERSEKYVRGKHSDVEINIGRKEQDIVWNREANSEDSQSIENKEKKISEAFEREEREKYSSSYEKRSKHNIESRFITKNGNAQLRLHLSSRNKNRRKANTSKNLKHEDNSTERSSEEGVNEGLAIASYEKTNPNTTKKIDKFLDENTARKQFRNIQRQSQVKNNVTAQRYSRYPQLKFWEGTAKSPVIRSTVMF